VLPNTLHVGGGALLLALSMTLTLLTRRLDWVARQEGVVPEVEAVGVHRLEQAVS